MHRGRGRGRGGGSFYVGGAGSVEVNFPKRLFFNLMSELKPNGIRARLNLDSGQAACNSDKDAESLRLLIAKLKINDSKYFVGLSEADSLEIALSSSDASTYQLISLTTNQIGSYSFEPLKRKIYIPGFAPRYQRPHTPCDLNPLSTVDSQSIDFNTATFDNALDPLLISMSVVSDSFNPSEYDFITDRNNLRKFFEVAMGQEKLWRIDAEKLQGSRTVFLKRFDLPKTNSDHANSYIGHAFEDLCVKKCVEPSHSYHPLVQVLVHYRDIRPNSTDSLKLLVRCQLDAVVSDLADVVSELTHATEVKMPASLSQVAIDGVFESNEPKMHRFVEIRSVKQKNWTKEGGDSHLDTWFQSYIVGVSKLAVGIKNESQSSILDIRELSPQSYMHEKLGGSPDAALGRFVELLKRIQDFMLDREDSDARWAFVADPDQSRISCRRPESNDRWVIPNWFLSIHNK